MNVLSLFDGISCGRVALDRIGVKPTRYFASEIEKHAVTITQNNWPDTIQLGDVTKVRKMAEAGLLPQIDLLIGGSPCQGFSNAGEGKGFADPRSRLFFEFVAIKALVKPRAFLLENVRMKQEWLDIISFWMGVQPVFINSADFSAQNRQRFYWSSHPVPPWTDRRALLRDVLEHLPTDKKGATVRQRIKFAPPSNGFVRCDTRGNLKQGVDKAGCLTAGGNSAGNHSDMDMIHSESFTRRYTVTEWERLQTLNDGYTQAVPDSARYKALGNAWTVDVIAHIMTGMGL